MGQVFTFTAGFKIVLNVLRTISLIKALELKIIQILNYLYMQNLTKPVRTNVSLKVLSKGELKVEGERV